MNLLAVTVGDSVALILAVGSLLTAITVIGNLIVGFNTRRDQRKLIMKQEAMDKRLADQAAFQQAAKEASDEAIATAVALGMNVTEVAALVAQTSRDLHVFMPMVDGQLTEFKKVLQERMDQKARADTAEAKIETDRTASELAVEVASATQEAKNQSDLDVEAARREVPPGTPPAAVAPVSTTIEATLHVPEQTLDVDDKEKSGT